MNLEKINECITVYRYTNGFMVEYSGEAEDKYPTVKMICATEKEVLDLLTKLFKVPLND